MLLRYVPNSFSKVQAKSQERRFLCAEMTVEIQLKFGYVALVDDEDYPEVSKHAWWLSRKGPKMNRFYVQSKIDGHIVSLHRFVTHAPSGIGIDHRDGNGLDCRKENLRLATVTQNLRNKKRYDNNLSGYKGVMFAKWMNQWRARIRVNGVLKHLGYFDNPILAARAYDSAAREFFGEFANTNFEE